MGHGSALCKSQRVAACPLKAQKGSGPEIPTIRPDSAARKLCPGMRNGKARAFRLEVKRCPKCCATSTAPGAERQRPRPSMGQELQRRELVLSRSISPPDQQ
jgi:hypothetical protein